MFYHVQIVVSACVFHVKLKANANHFFLPQTHQFIHHFFFIIQISFQMLVKTKEQKHFILLTVQL